MPGCRIGKVKLKAGAEIHRLPAIQRDEAQKRFVERAAMIAGFYKPGEIVGYALMVWDKDGNHSVGYYLDEQSVVGMTMAPSYVADALRRRMLEDGDWETP
ncbi:hypothetical protein [Agrobacterium tumefaciens]|uniref:hypothetical protein n=1 Tax=Agrobacterium tumefaciens TaxID=358 RepID=UPI00045B9CCC|nr:hypothetical protein [Agrobacterium tumefaciens]CDN96076.1 hypothetical protein BN949_05251 [Agrobacterium tumefaciens]